MVCGRHISAGNVVYYEKYYIFYKDLARNDAHREKDKISFDVQIIPGQISECAPSTFKCEDKTYRLLSLICD